MEERVWEVEERPTGFVWGPCMVVRLTEDRRGGVWLYITGSSVKRKRFVSDLLLRITPGGRIVVEDKEGVR